MVVALELLDAEERPPIFEAAAEELYQVPTLHGRDDGDFWPPSSRREASLTTTQISLFFVSP